MRVHLTLGTELDTLPFTLFSVRDEKQGLEVALYKNKWERRYHTNLSCLPLSPCSAPGEKTLEERNCQKGQFQKGFQLWKLNEN